MRKNTKRKKRRQTFLYSIYGMKTARTMNEKVSRIKIMPQLYSTVTVFSQTLAPNAQISATFAIALILLTSSLRWPKSRFKSDSKNIKITPNMQKYCTENRD